MQPLSATLGKSIKSTAASIHIPPPMSHQPEPAPSSAPELTRAAANPLRLRHRIARDFVLDQSLQLVHQARILDFNGSSSAGVGSRSRGASLATELKQSGDGRKVNVEAAGKLTVGALVVINGGQDSLTEVR